MDVALDNAALARLRDDLGEETLADLIDLYLEDAPKLVADMKNAAKRADASGVQLAAHTLKSTSEAMGAKVLASACGELEQDGHEGKLDSAKEKVERVTQLCDAALSELQRHRGRLSNG